MYYPEPYLLDATDSSHTGVVAIFTPPLAASFAKSFLRAVVAHVDFFLLSKARPARNSDIARQNRDWRIKLVRASDGWHFATLASSFDLLGRQLWRHLRRDPAVFGSGCGSNTALLRFVRGPREGAEPGLHGNRGAPQFDISGSRDTRAILEW